MNAARLGAAFTLLLSSALPALAQAGPTEAPAAVTSLPSGPGSVSGLSSTTDVSPFNGQVSWSIPLPLPPGRAGFGPGHALSYSGSLGNGPLGIGWSLGVPQLRRSTLEGVPTYTDADTWELANVSSDGGADGRLVAIAPDEFRVEGAGQGVRVLGAPLAGFQVITSDGLIWSFDVPQADPDDPSRVFSWRPSTVTDLAGQQVTYAYLADAGTLYLAGIAWGPNVACDGQPAAPAFAATFDHEPRPDEVSSWLTGFLVETRLRLTRVTITAHCEQRSALVLGYDPDPELATSRLRTVTQTGRGGAGTVAPLTFSYGTDLAQQSVQLTGVDGWALGVRGVTLLDVDGDGLDDLARFELNNREWKRNLGGTFAAATPLPGGDLRPLDDLQLLDLDGDARPEMVYQVDVSWRVYRLESATFVEAGDWPGTSQVDLTGGDRVFADVDGDRRVDLLRSKTSGLAWHRSEPTGLADPLVRGPAVPGEPYLDPGDDRLRFTDANGDGLVDILWLGHSKPTIFPGRGDATFAPGEPWSYPWPEAGVDPSRVLLGDLNRDGLIDVLRVEAAHVYWWAGRPGGFSQTLTGKLERPPGQPYDATVSLADLNGNGSTDLVWSSPQGLWLLDLAGPISQAMLHTVTNGLGETRTYGYSTSARLAVAAAETGHPWSSFSPTIVPVPYVVVVDSGTTSPAVRTCYGVRDGFWDAEERRFGGFLTSFTMTPVDLPSDPTDPCLLEGPTGITRTDYLAGEGPSRVLRGRPYHELIWDHTGTVYSERFLTWDAQPVTGLPDHPWLRVPVQLAEVSDVYEGQPTPVTTRSETTHDGEGRPIEERHLGRTDTPSDDRRTTRSYATNPTTWVRGRPCSEILYDAEDDIVRQAVTLYDDLPLCTVERGLVTSTLGWLDDPTTPRWVTLTEADHDTWGNPIRTVEAGVERFLDWEALSLHPTAETLYPTPTEPLTWTFTWDPVLGQPTRAEDPSGAVQEVDYDPLGRVTAARVDADGDGTAETTTTTWEYHWQPSDAPRPYTIARRHEDHPDVPDGETWQVADGSGRELYTATLAELGLAGSTPTWSIDGYRQRDARGRTTWLSRPFASPGGPLAASPPPGQPGFTVTYDALDRETAQTLPTGAVHTIGRGLASAPGVVRAITQTDDLAPVTRVLDAYGRIVHTERIIPDPDDPDGGDPVQETADATYDAADQPTAFILQPGTPDQVTHAWTWDTLGRLTGAHDPDIGPRSHTWTDEGWLAATANGAQDTVTLTYDAIGRLTERRGTATAGPATRQRFLYDAPPTTCDPAAFSQGRLVSLIAEDGDGAGGWLPVSLVDHCHDPQGRIDTATHQVHAPTGPWTLETRTDMTATGAVLAVHRDLLGTAATITHTFDQDPAGALRALSFAAPATAATPLWERLQTSPAGELLVESHGNGLATGYDRDVLGLTAGLRLAPLPGGATLSDSIEEFWSGATSALYDTTFARNAYGAITTVTADPTIPGAMPRDAAFTFDGAGRLIDATVAGYDFRYRYDPLQNMVLRTVSAALPATASALLTGSFQHGPAAAGPRRLVAADGHTFTWDAAGRVTDIDVAASGWSRVQTWDAFDRLRQVDDSAAGTSEYAYGADGERVWSLAPDGSVIVRFDGQVRLHDGKLEVYGHAGDRAVARVDVAAADGVVGVTYLHNTFGVGPALLTDAGGAVLEERFHEPFGVLLGAWRPDASQPVVWSGFGLADAVPLEALGALNKPVDRVTGWSDHGARWMAPEIGRWLSADPPVKGPAEKFMAAPWDLHPFQYGRSNPVVFWDPDGRELGGLTKLAYGLGFLKQSDMAATSAESVERALAREGRWHPGPGDPTSPEIGPQAIDPSPATLITNKDLPAIEHGVHTIRRAVAEEQRDIAAENHEQAHDGYKWGLATAAVLGALVLPKTAGGLRDSNRIRFTQDSIGTTFKDGRSVKALVGDLKSGAVKPRDLPPIRIFEKDGLVFSLDNRRLFAAREAGVKVHTVPATAAEIAKELPRKFTTKNNGTIIGIRGVLE